MSEYETVVFKIGDATRRQVRRELLEELIAEAESIIDNEERIQWWPGGERWQDAIATQRFLIARRETINGTSTNEQRAETPVESNP